MVLSLLAAPVLVACQPLYGEKPDKLPKVQTKPKPKDAEPEPLVKDVDDCTADFHGDPKGVRQNIPASASLTSEGDTALNSSEKPENAKDGQAQASLLHTAVEDYRNALIKDPYNPDATLKLALAYDRVFKKGCAIAMLKRLMSLTSNPKFATKAQANIDSISDNSQWFRRYRKDALAAVGR